MDALSDSVRSLIAGRGVAASGCHCLRVCLFACSFGRGSSSVLACVASSRALGGSVFSERRLDGINKEIDAHFSPRVARASASQPRGQLGRWRHRSRVPSVLGGAMCCVVGRGTHSRGLRLRAVFVGHSLRLPPLVAPFAFFLCAWPYRARPVAVPASVAASGACPGNVFFVGVKRGMSLHFSPRLARATASQPRSQLGRWRQTSRVLLISVWGSVVGRGTVG